MGSHAYEPCAQTRHTSKMMKGVLVGEFRLKAKNSILGDNYLPTISPNSLLGLKIIYMVHYTKLFGFQSLPTLLQMPE